MLVDSRTGRNCVVRADFLVERRRFRTADLRSAGAAREKDSAASKAYITAERPLVPTLDLRQLHSPFAWAKARQADGRRTLS